MPCFRRLWTGHAADGSFPLPKGKKYHFFVCHHQGSGGDQANILFNGLERMGFKVWWDNGQAANERTLQGMKRGVRDSMCLLIFLSGRKETAGQGDINGQYEGPFTRWFCHEEMATAQDNNLVFVGVMEQDERHGKADMAQERLRARTGGLGGGPVHLEHVERNLRLLDDVCFIPFERQAHLMPAMLQEIARQLNEKAPQPGAGAQLINACAERCACCKPRVTHDRPSTPALQQPLLSDASGESRPASPELGPRNFAENGPSDESEGLCFTGQKAWVRQTKGKDLDRYWVQLTVTWFDKLGRPRFAPSEDHSLADGILRYEQVVPTLPVDKGDFIWACNYSWEWHCGRVKDFTEDMVPRVSCGTECIACARNKAKKLQRMQQRLVEIQTREEQEADPWQRSQWQERRRCILLEMQEQTNRSPTTFQHYSTTPPGFTMDMLIEPLDKGEPLVWKYAASLNGQSFGRALAVSAGRLFLWHLIQPPMYFLVLYEFHTEIDALQLHLGLAVALRELGYLVSTLLCTWINPAFLLVDVNSSVQDYSRSNYGWLEKLGTPTDGLICMLMYVLAPEKFVGLALFDKGGLNTVREHSFTNRWALRFTWLYGMLSTCLDLCGIAALMAGVGSGMLPLPLAVGYTVTALGGTLLAGASIVGAVMAGVASVVERKGQLDESEVVSILSVLAVPSTLLGWAIGVPVALNTGVAVHIIWLVAINAPLLVMTLLLIFTVPAAAAVVLSLVDIGLAVSAATAGILAREHNP